MDYMIMALIICTLCTIKKYCDTNENRFIIWIGNTWIIQINWWPKHSVARAKTEMIQIYGSHTMIAKTICIRMIWPIFSIKIITVNLRSSIESVGISQRWRFEPSRRCFIFLWSSLLFHLYDAAYNGNLWLYGQFAILIVVYLIST